MDMLEGVTLNQLRTSIAAVDEGSFSAAGRKLRRARSVVSQTLANLEAQLGVKLFDRSARYPRLTEEGRSLLADARAVADHIDGFKARARAMKEGLEPELASSRRFCAQNGDVDEGRVSQGCAAWSCGPGLHRAARQVRFYFTARALLSAAVHHTKS